MTKDEYKAKREASANAGFTAIATYINDSMIKDEYIESLESRIAELEAALRLADEEYQNIIMLYYNEEYAPSNYERWIKAAYERWIKTEPEQEFEK